MVLSIQNEITQYLDLIHIDFSHCNCKVCSLSNLQVSNYPLLFAGGGGGAHQRFVCLQEYLSILTSVTICLETELIGSLRLLPDSFHFLSGKSVSRSLIYQETTSRTKPGLHVLFVTRCGVDLGKRHRVLDVTPFMIETSHDLFISFVPSQERKNH